MIIVINVYDMLELDVYGKMKSQARSVCSVGGGEWWECEAGGQCKLHWEGGTEQRLGDRSLHIKCPLKGKGPLPGH